MLMLSMLAVFKMPLGWIRPAFGWRALILAAVFFDWPLTELTADEFDFLNFDCLPEFPGVDLLLFNMACCLRPGESQALFCAPIKSTHDLNLFRLDVVDIS